MGTVLEDLKWNGKVFSGLIDTPDAFHDIYKLYLKSIIFHIPRWSKLLLLRLIVWNNTPLRWEVWTFKCRFKISFFEIWHVLSMCESLSVGKGEANDTVSRGKRRLNHGHKNFKL